MAVNHIVYFKFTDDASAADIEAHMDAFEMLGQSVPGITGYSAGKTFSVDYETTGDYDSVHIAVYESQEALETYFHHEKHQAFIEEFKHIWADVLVVNTDL